MDICRCAGDLRDLIHAMKISSRPRFPAEDYNHPRLPLDFFEFPCFYYIMKWSDTLEAVLM